MQRPTLTNVHIRSAADAHKLFYAVQLGRLPKIEKRLDANERAALRPGDVYVWEEKGPNTDAFSVSMERFTEGKSWTASRVREDFLMYFESPKKGKGNAKSSENQVVRPGEQDLYIKLTYSVIREPPHDPSQPKGSDDALNKKPPKWHMNAYFTKLTEGQLRTIDDIPELRALEVPEGIFKSARLAKPGKRGEGSRNAGSSVKRTYAPFPSHPTRRARSSTPSHLAPPPPPPPPMAGPSTHPDAMIMDPSYPIHPDSLTAAPEVGSIPLYPPPNALYYNSPSEYVPQQQAFLSPADPPRAKPPLSPLAPAPFLGNPPSHPTPLYGWNTEYSFPTSIDRPPSPAFSERSTASFGFTRALSCSVSGSGSSEGDSPMIAPATPPLWDNGEPYKPAPALPISLPPPVPRVDLAPLEQTLPRSFIYRRSSADDRALRLLASGAR